MPTTETAADSRDPGVDRNENGFHDRCQDDQAGKMNDTNNQSVPPADKPPRPALMGKLLKKVPLNLLRFWWAFGIIPCVGLGVAAMLSSQMASTTYSFDATILYSGVPVESAAEKLYIPPDLKTMTQFIKSPYVMQAVCEELNLPVPPNALSSMITVVEPKSMQRIGLTLGWSDQEEGKKILDQVIDVYSKHISETRQEVVGRYLVDLQRRLDGNESRLGAAKEKVRKFLQKANVQNAETELELLIDEIGALQVKRENKEREIEGYRAQRDSVVTLLEKQKEDAVREAEEDEKNAAAEESLADNRRRQDRLNELIREERRLAEVRSEMKAVKPELDRARSLYEQDFISLAELESKQATYDGLKSQLLENETIVGYKNSLKSLDEMIVPDSKKKNKSSPIITQTLYKVVELNLEILQRETEIGRLVVDLVSKRRKVKELQMLEQESTSLTKEVDAASEERDRINAQMSALRTVHDYGPHEFSVVSPASDAMSYPSSNKKKLFLLMFVGITGALSGPFVLIAILMSFKQTVEERCLDLDIDKLSPGQSLLELLTESNADRARELYHWNRRVGLSLQQSIDKPGAVISVFPTSHRHRDMELLASMGGILADRDEDILLIELCAPRESADLIYRRELRGQREEHVSTADALLWMVTMEYGKPPRGLFDYLDGHIDSDADLVNRIDGSRCHLIHIGREHGHFDRVFSQRMNDLIAKCRDQYSMIIMYGPELHREVDVELQCRHTDGVVVLYDRGESLSQDVSSTLDQMMDLGVRFLGCAGRPLAFTAPGSPGLLARVVSRLSPFARTLSTRMKRRPPLLARLFSLLLKPITVPFRVMFQIFKSSLLKAVKKRHPIQPSGKPEGSGGTDRQDSEKKPAMASTGETE